MGESSRDSNHRTQLESGYFSSLVAAQNIFNFETESVILERHSRKPAMTSSMLDLRFILDMTQSTVYKRRCRSLSESALRGTDKSSSSNFETSTSRGVQTSCSSDTFGHSGSHRPIAVVRPYLSAQGSINTVHHRSEVVSVARQLATAADDFDQRRGERRPRGAGGAGFLNFMQIVYDVAFNYLAQF